MPAALTGMAYSSDGSITPTPSAITHEVQAKFGATGGGLQEEQQALHALNITRLKAASGSARSHDPIGEVHLRWREIAFVERMRTDLAGALMEVPGDTPAFLAWLKQLSRDASGSGWLTDYASHEATLFLLDQQTHAFAFQDHLAITSAWDKVDHCRALSRLHQLFGLASEMAPPEAIAEALACANLMCAFAHNPRYAAQLHGAIGVIAARGPFLLDSFAHALRRLKITPETSAPLMHAALTTAYAERWIDTCLAPVASDEARARLVAEGAMLWLECERRLFERCRMQSRPGL